MASRLSDMPFDSIARSPALAQSRLDVVDEWHILSDYSQSSWCTFDNASANLDHAEHVSMLWDTSVLVW